MGMTRIDFAIPKKILGCLANKADNFYLAGGTALSMFYYQHRESYDLDFFTKEFSKDRVLAVIQYLENSLPLKTELAGEQLKEGMAKMVVYMAVLPGGERCKIDFVEDFVDRIGPLRTVDGIRVLSLEDIYLRKIYAVAGHVRSQDVIGQDIVIGGRQEAKDFYDLYCLSNLSTPLSDFVSQWPMTLKEGLIRWFRTYDRMAMKTGLLDLITKSQPDYRRMEEHFKKEIDKLLSSLVGEN